MIKTYKKVATIKAEQFDGSDEIVRGEWTLLDQEQRNVSKKSYVTILKWIDISVIENKN